MKYLIIRTTTEDESMVTVVELTEEYAKTLGRRQRLVKNFHPAEDLYYMVFHCECELYDDDSNFEEFGDWLAEDDPGGGFALADAYEANNWCVSESMPPFDPQSRIRVSSSSIRISDNGLWLELNPKHWNHSVETAFIGTLDAEEIYG